MDSTLDIPNPRILRLDQILKRQTAIHSVDLNIDLLAILLFRCWPRRDLRCL
jgi:hypothetical protein